MFRRFVIFFIVFATVTATVTGCSINNDISSRNNIGLPSLTANDISYIDVCLLDGNDLTVRIEDQKQIREIINVINAVIVEINSVARSDKDLIPQDAIGFFIHSKSEDSTDEITINISYDVIKIYGKFYTPGRKPAASLRTLGGRILDIGSYRTDYFYLSKWNGNGEPGDEFRIWKEFGKTYFECSSSSIKSIADILIEVEGGVFDDLSAVIRANEINRWNGFDKSADHTDGDGFSLNMEYENLSIHAYGYGSRTGYRPLDFERGYDALYEFLMDYYQGLQLSELEVNSVKSIRIVGTNYSIDVSGEIRVYQNLDRTFGESYVFSSEDINMDYGLERQLRERVVDFELIKGYPRLSDEEKTEYAVIEYRGIMQNSHQCYALLSGEEQNNVNEMVKEILGLPADYDWGDLFGSIGEPNPPVRKYFDEETRTLIILADSEIGTIRCTLPEIYTSYHFDRAYPDEWKDTIIKHVSILKEKQSQLFIDVFIPSQNLYEEMENCERITLGNNDWLFKIEQFGQEMYYAPTEKYILRVVSAESEAEYIEAVKEIIQSFVIE